MRRLLVLPLLAPATFGFAPGPTGAPAVAATTCQEQFALLEADTQSVAISAGKEDKERAGLLKLITDAEATIACLAPVCA